MKKLENESKKHRITRIIKEELIPKMEVVAGPISEECIELIISRAKLKLVAKDQFFQEECSYEDGQLHYIYSGIAWSYHEDFQTGKLVVDRIWKKNEVMFDAVSFIKNIDTTESFQMLENGEILSLDYYSLKIILDRFPILSRMSLCMIADREVHHKFYQRLLKLTVDERVKLYLDKNPTLMSRINRDCIALFLSISRSSLSAAYAIYKQQKNT